MGEKNGRKMEDRAQRRGTFFISEVIPGRARPRHLQAAQAAPS